MATTSEMMLDRGRSVLVVIDVQEAYRGVTCDHDMMLAGVLKLLRSAALLGVPVIATEQFPKGLGHLLPEVLELLPAGSPVIEKASMSCCGAPDFTAALSSLGKRQVVLCGIETHACVNQTAQDLMARGFQVHLVRDAISSRTAIDRDVGWAKAIQCGAVPATVEMAALEWVRTAQAPEFKAIHSIIK